MNGMSRGSTRPRPWTAALATAGLAAASMASSQTAQAQTWSQAAQAHQAAQAQTQGRSAATTFAVALPVSMKWAPDPAIPGATSAVVLGDPTKPQPYVARVRLPDGHRMAPHVHPDDRVYTVLAGHIRIGLGEAFDDAKLEDCPTGTVYHLPARTPRFQVARGETILQYTATGPSPVASLGLANEPGKK